jgi:hypothetical protein
MPQPCERPLLLLILLPARSPDARLGAGVRVIERARNPNAPIDVAWTLSSSTSSPSPLVEMFSDDVLAGVEPPVVLTVS